MYTVSRFQACRGVRVRGVVSYNLPQVYCKRQQRGVKCRLLFGEHHMNLILRADAKRNNQATYFTGRPCKNNHIAYRYTQSGTCSECINGDRKKSTDPEVTERRNIRAELVKVPLRAYDVDRDNLAAAAWALAMMRYPVLTLADIDPRLLPQGVAAGTAMYTMLCHADDVGQLRAIAGDMVKAHRADVVTVRRAAFGPAADGLPVRE